MIVSQIAAMAKNRVIGSNNDLPWHIPEDLKFFRDKTKGHVLIMGRKTFESVGSKPMPHRLNVIITRNPEFKAEGCHVFQSIESALEFAKTQTQEWGEEVFIAGGAEIYKLAMPFTDRIYLTEIDREFEGDTYFPEFDTSIYKEVERISRTEPVPFAFVTYEKS